MRTFALCLMLPLAPNLALAQSCNDEVGQELAAVYVDQCIAVSPATRRPAMRRTAAS